MMPIDHANMSTHELLEAAGYYAPRGTNPYRPTNSTGQPGARPVWERGHDACTFIGHFDYSAANALAISSLKSRKEL